MDAFFQKKKTYFNEEQFRIKKQLRKINQKNLKQFKLQDFFEKKLFIQDSSQKASEQKNDNIEKVDRKLENLNYMYSEQKNSNSFVKHQKLQDLNEAEKSNNELLLVSIPWGEGRYEKRLDSNTGFVSYVLFEPLKSQRVRMEYSEQKAISPVLRQINNSDEKMVQLLKLLSQKQKELLNKCLICAQIQYGKKVVVCQRCHDNFHMNCLKIEKEKGMFFHESEIELNTFLSELSNKKNKKEDVFWSCQKCTTLIFKAERIETKLMIPFQIQVFPENIFTLNSATINIKLLINISNYCIPENFEDALKERNLQFQDECVFLTSAKIIHNSVTNSEELINVNFLFLLTLYE